MLAENVLLFFYIASISFFIFFLQHTLTLTDCFYSLINNNQDLLVFDYIVVGGGSAGALLANRLSSNKQNKVLLLEAGRDIADFLHVPAMGLLLQQTSYNWGYKTVPQVNACKAFKDNVCLWPMGKVLGGTGMLNNMLYIRGHKADFDEWFKENEDYNYLDILKYFRKLEANSESSDGCFCIVFLWLVKFNILEVNKPIYVRDLVFKTELQNVVLKAASGMGYNTFDTDLNCKLGFNKPKANLYKGQRWTGANYIKKHPYSNLEVKTNSFVDQVVLESNFEAKGVTYTQLGYKYTAFANKGVILAAGVIGSPKILMLSGIGPKDHLASLGISTVANLPVGDNLKDHVTTGFDLILLNHTLKSGVQSMLSLSSVWNYFSKGSGPWTTTGCDAMAFFKIKQNNTDYQSNRPDLQFMVMPVGITEDKGYYLRHLVGISDLIWDKYYSKINQTALTILPVLLHPKSKGYLRLQGKNPNLAPIINPQYLSNPDDVDLLIDGIKLVKQLVETKTFRSFGAQFNTHHFPGCEQYKFNTKPYWECYLGYVSFSAYHPVGTCKIGSVEDPTTVVDFNFKVKGMNKLYVVDGSVLPTLPSGNTNGPILMLAEMAADLISKEDYLSGKKCFKLDVLVPRVIC